jgi:ATP-dependent RNA helicase SUPV3L1/SUV3
MLPGAISLGLSGKCVECGTAIAPWFSTCRPCSTGPGGRGPGREKGSREGAARGSRPGSRSGSRQGRRPSHSGRG